MRARSPSTTLTLTSTVSPGPKSGISLPAESFAICSCSSSWIRFMANSPSAARCGAHFCRIFKGRRRLYDRPAHLSSVGRRTPDPVEVGRPQVRPALAGQALGFAPAERGNFGVIAGDEHVRDGSVFPDLRARVLRVFEQRGGKALLCARSLLAHDA